MSKSNTTSSAYVRKFSFRRYEGTRRGRIYRLWAVSWHWWAHQWERSLAVKFFIGFLIFTFVLTNMFLFSMKDSMLLPDPYTGESLTTNELLENNMMTMIRGVVTFGMSFSSETSGGTSTMSIGGTSIFILILVALVGSGLIADDISNKTNEIYYSKLEKYEYVLGKFGAFFLFGNIVLVLPYVFEFFLLVIGIGNIDMIAALPVLITVILFTELITITYSSIILALSSLTNRRLYAGLSAFMLLFVINMIVPRMAFTGEEVNLIILFDVLTVLLLISYILTGTTTLEYQFMGSSGHMPGRLFVINLTDGIGLESWMVLGALGFYILLGLLIVVFQVYWRHSK